MSILRSCSTALASALGASIGNIPYQADLFTLNLASGTTLYYASWDSDLVVGGHTFLSANPWLTRSRWNVTNTMEVPGLEVKIAANSSDFLGGANLKLQAVRGLFDGGTLFLQRLFMPTPGDTTTYGTVDIFKGDTGAAQIVGNGIVLKVKGSNNKLDVPAPRNTYQPSCLHSFCDTGCTLSAATYTTTYTVSTASTSTFVNWTAVVLTAGHYMGGTVKFLTGTNAGQTRTVVGFSSSGLTVATPLIAAPLSGDTFAAFQGCNKTVGPGTATGGLAGTFGCQDYANILNFRGFPNVPANSVAANGSF